MTKRVTGHDVARLAGVTQATVSRALRNLPGTAPETRDRVLRAAAQLAYIPSDNARSLSNARTRRVAVVSDALTNPYYPQLVEPIRRHLTEHAMQMVLVTETGQAEDRRVGLEALADGSYDGAILTTTTRRSTLPRDLTERAIPHVLVNRVLDVPESPGCTVDNAGGVAQVADLLARLGHQRVAAVHGPTDTSTGRERAVSLRTGLRRHGLPLPRALVRQSAFDHDSAMAAAASLLDERDRPTAIVGANDVIGLGILSAARAAGIRVPEDLTVTGFDDIPMAGWPLVGLTTVHCDLDALARMSVDLLTRQLAGEPVKAVTLRIPVSLVERRTHGPWPVP
ncbi:MAG: LacI family DNA-binding transcriptional regulator [Lapillicoccus sp.]